MSRAFLPRTRDYLLPLSFPTRRSSDLFPSIVREVRWELDLRGHKDVQIFVSGSVDEGSIPALAEAGADGFGVGTSLSKDRKSTRLNSSHRTISYAVFCLKKKKKITQRN